MRILIVGAGAVGTLFGSALHQHGVDVQFLLRPARKALIDREGLTLITPVGQQHFQPRTVSKDQLVPGYDLIVLSNKAYALEGVVADIAGALDAQTLILPLLNGLRHLDVLDAAFGQGRVLGGVARTIATLATPTTVQVSNGHSNMSIGARLPAQQDSVNAIGQRFSEAGIDVEVSNNIVASMWDKFCRMAASGAANCLLGGAVCDYMRSDAGGQIALQLFKECTDTAAAAGYPMHPQAIAGFQALLTNPASSFNSSMYRDMRAGLPVEGDHLVGDMRQRATAAGQPAAMLSIANAVLQTYSARLAAAQA